MFISNKTLNFVKTIGILILSALVVIVVGQGILFIKLTNDTNKKMDHFVSLMDSLNITTQKFDTLSFNKQEMTDVRLGKIKRSVDSLTVVLENLTQVTQTNKEVTNLLVSNECNVRPYYMEKSLLAMCK